MNNFLLSKAEEILVWYFWPPQVNLLCELYFSENWKNAVLNNFLILYFQADASLELERRDFIRAGLEYVCLIQEVQERKKFEFVETVSTHTIF